MKLTGRHSFLGIAIGERAIAVAEVGPARGGARGWEVRRAGEFTPPAPVSAAADADVPAMGEALAKFLRDNGFTGGARAVVGVPARWLVARERDLPPSNDDAAAEVLRMQAERVFSAELGELAVDFAGTADPQAARGVLLLAMKKAQLARIVRIVESAGRDVAAVMPSTLALADAAAAGASSRGRRTDGLVLSLGGDAVELAAHRGGAPRLLRHLAVRGPDLASPNGTRDAAVASLAGEIRRTVALMPRTPDDAPIVPGAPLPGHETLRLWDGVGLNHDDAVTLARQAGVDLRGGGPDDLSSLGLVAPGDHVTGPLKTAASRCAPALALALAGAIPRPGAVDFLHPRLAPPKRRRVGKRTGWAAGVAALAALLLVGLWAEVRWRESNLADVNARLDALGPNVAAAERTSQLISVARGWYPEGRPPALDCLREITDAFPDGGEAIYVTKFSLPETRQGSFLGRAPNQELVLDLVARMNKNKAAFKDVHSTYILDAGGSSKEVAFSITFRYERAAGGAPAAAPATAEQSQNGKPR